MGYQSRMRTRGSFGRGHGVQQRKKAKVKGQKRRSGGSYALEETHVRTSEEVLAEVLNRLRSLGNQRFVLSPFSEHFDRWSGTLRDAVFEFESSPPIGVDDQFLKERSQILSNVELELEERRREEASLDKITESLSGKRALLEQIEEEHYAKTRELEGQEASEIKRLSAQVEGIREELDRIAKMKTGILRRFSERARKQKVAEATQRLNSAQTDLASATEHFSAEKQRLRTEYEKKKRPITEQIRDLQKEVENLEIDGSLEARRAACEALADAVSALVRRKRPSPNQTS
jgi:chromosome segregation ATPase